MKILITNYVFDTSARTITFSDYTSISLAGVLLITNVTNNTIIYNFADPTKGGTVLGNVLTLTYGTTGMAATDKLQIFYDDSVIPAKEDGNLALLKQESEPYTRLIDDVSVANKTFVGYASPGTSETNAVWRIICLDETGSYLKVGYADGVSTFTKVWNNRTTYNYL